MAAKPSTTPRWANVLVGAIVEPSSGEKDTGGVPGTAPPARKINWLFNLIWQWIVYLEDIANIAWTWTVVHTFQRGIIVTQATANTSGVTTTGNGVNPGVFSVGGSGGGTGVIGIGAGVGVGGSFIGGNTAGATGLLATGGIGGAIGILGTGTNNNQGGNFLGHGGAPGVTATGGSGGGTGGTFTGGTGGNGLSSTCGAGSTAIVASGGDIGVYGSGSVVGLEAGPGNMRFTGTQPTKTADPGGGINNYLCGTNVCKAWGYFEVSGSAALYQDGYNITTIVLKGGDSTKIVVTLERNMANSNYAVTFGNEGFNEIAYIVPGSKTGGSFEIAAFTSSAAVIDFAIGTFNLSFQVMGRQ